MLRRGAQPADARKVETELQEDFTNVTFADPTVVGTQQDGNFGRNRILITTPATANTELFVAHGLGRVPVGIDFTLPNVAGGGKPGTVLRSKAWDSTNVYLKFPNAADQSLVTSIAIW